MATSKINVGEMELTANVSETIPAGGLSTNAFTVPTGFIPKSAYYSVTSGANGVIVSNPVFYTSGGGKKALVFLFNSTSGAINVDGTLHLFCNKGGVTRDTLRAYAAQVAA